MLDEAVRPALYDRDDRSSLETRRRDVSVAPLARFRHVILAPLHVLALGQPAQVALQARLEQPDRLALGCRCRVSTNGVAADVDGRFGDDGTYACRIGVPGQGAGDPQNRPRRSAHDMGERRLEVLAVAPRNRSSNADGGLYTRLDVTGR